MSKLSKALFESGGEATDALTERGQKQLFRLSVLIDVLFAMLIYQIFLFLPRPEVDGFTKDDLVEVLSTSYLNYLVMFVGFVLILIYWIQSNLQFGNMIRTDGRHATLSVLQVISLMIYLYFVRLDVEFDGTVIALQMESVFLAISGFLGLWSWHYAVRNNLLSEKLTKVERDKVYLKLTPEPVVSLLSFPFAVFGPDVWTLSWLLLIPVGYTAKYLRKRMSAREGE
jgi:hypothetical protein